MADPAVGPVGHRRAWAEVDLGAVAHNLRALLAAAGGAEVWAVVKADAYGHGAVPVAGAVLGAGARGLAVALVEEGAVLRGAGIEAPILLLSEPPAAAMADVVRLGLTATLYTRTGVEALGRASGLPASRPPIKAHVKVDTGMHRVGATPDEAVVVAQAVAAHPRLELEGVSTHLAVADDPDQAEVTASQLARFDGFCTSLDDVGITGYRRHAANSAGILMVGALYDMVRPGIAVYGYHPNSAAPSTADLHPALSLLATVVHVRELDAGERLSYGLRYRLAERSVVATVPLGYADGVPRRLSETGGEVLIGGRRRPIAGTVTMDQIMVDCGQDASVAVGDEVVLLGRQGGDVITATEWATRLGTISYEILCSIGPRVPRTYRA